MSKFTVELDAYAIPDDHVVFKCSPGKTYRFYVAVRDAKVVFPDIRGLETLQGPPKDWADKDILAVIASDRWQRELVSRSRGNKEQGTEEVSRIDRRNLTFLKRLFFEGKKGDLVVVPVEGYAKEVLIGEFLSDPGDIASVEAQDGSHVGKYLGRPVRWRATAQKRLLSDELIKGLHTQTAVFALARSLREEVYRHAYANFVYMGQFVSEFRTAKQKFTAEDSAVVSTWLNGFDVLRDAIDRGTLQDLEKQTFFELGLKQLDDSRAAELRINIQSPGEIFVRYGTAFPLALMVMFALSGCEPKAVVDNGVTVQLKAVGAVSNDPQDQIEQCANALIQALGQPRLDQSCGLGVRAEKDAKMSTGAILQQQTKKRT